MAAAGDQDSLFGALGFHGFMQQHVHRKLHVIAERFAPEKLLELGQMSFKEQFTSLGLPGPAEERQSQPMPGLQTLPSRSTSSVFGPAGRSGYLHQRIHKKLHPYVIPLSDGDLLNLGKMGTEEQFSAMGQPGPSAGGLFDASGREGYLQARVHRRLHLQARALSNEDLFNLGQLSFHEQFTMLEGPPHPDTNQASVFGSQDRNTFVQAHVHRKLHAHILGMSDEDVLHLGKQNFNEQFRTLGVDNAPLAETLGAVNAAEGNPFGTLDRDSYIQARVHRKLHGQITHMSDEEVLSLGKLSFNEQFRALGLDAGPAPIDQTLPFGALDRDSYIQMHIHRRLHLHVANMSDEEVVTVGRASFNEQFRMVGVDQSSMPTAEELRWRLREKPQAPAAAPAPTPAATAVQPLQGLTRSEYMQQRIHRKLHSQAAYLSDQEMTEVGELSFNEQFSALEAVLARKKPAGGKGKSLPPLPAASPGATASTLFGGLDRNSFMMQRVHRKLHGRATRLDDESLAKLGRLSFNEQFPTMDQLDGLTTVA